MLTFAPLPTETFSSALERGEGLAWGVNRPGLADSARLRGFGHSHLAGEDMAMAVATMERGDHVTFERVDLAEALGIWRHARGRIVGIHGRDGASATIDVQFDGHAVLERYLPDLFRRVH